MCISFIEVERKGVKKKINIYGMNDIHLHVNLYEYYNIN